MNRANPAHVPGRKCNVSGLPGSTNDSCKVEKVAVFGFFLARKLQYARMAVTHSGVILVGIVQREHDLYEGPRRHDCEARQCHMRCTLPAMHVLDDGQFCGDSRQAGNTGDNDEKQKDELPVVLKLGPVAHVML